MNAGTKVVLSGLLLLGNVNVNHVQKIDDDNSFASSSIPTEGWGWSIGVNKAQATDYGDCVIRHGAEYCNGGGGSDMGGDATQTQGQEEFKTHGCVENAFKPNLPTQIENDGWTLDGNGNQYYKVGWDYVNNTSTAVTVGIFHDVKVKSTRTLGSSGYEVVVQDTNSGADNSSASYEYVYYGISSLSSNIVAGRTITSGTIGTLNKGAKMELMVFRDSGYDNYLNNPSNTIYATNRSSVILPIHIGDYGNRQNVCYYPNN